jgi:hypothetical protein
MLKSTLQPHMTTAVKISVITAINQLYLSINYPVVYDIGRIVRVWNMLKSTLQPHMTTAVKISVITAINQLYLSINYPVVYDIGRIVTVRNMSTSYDNCCQDISKYSYKSIVLEY